MNKFCFATGHFDGSFKNFTKEDLLTEANATYPYASRRSKDLAMLGGFACKSKAQNTSMKLFEGVSKYKKNTKYQPQMGS